MTDTDDDTRRRIVEETEKDPWASQQEIADRVGVSRPWVTEVVKEHPDLRDARTFARNGVEFDDPHAMLRVIRTLQEQGQLPEEAADVLLMALDQQDLQAINVQFVGGSDGG